jgi:hypothetical protein
MKQWPYNLPASVNIQYLMSDRSNQQTHVLYMIQENRGRESYKMQEQAHRKRTCELSRRK